MPKSKVGTILILDQDLVLLFQALGYTGYQSLVCALVVQKIARLQAKRSPKHFSLDTDELLQLFCFVSPRTLKRCIAILRELGIWKNTPYKPKHNMRSYVNIRISWKSIAKLAKQVQGEGELSAIVKQVNGK